MDAALEATAATGALVRIPIAVKDIFDTAGSPTERGSALYAGRIAEIVPVQVPRPRQFGMEALDEFQRATSRIRQLIFGVERTTVH